MSKGSKFGEFGKLVKFGNIYQHFQRKENPAWGQNDPHFSISVSRYDYLKDMMLKCCSQISPQNNLFTANIANTFLSHSFWCMRSHTISEWLMQYSAVDIEYIQYICNIMWEPEGFEKVSLYGCLRFSSIWTKWKHAVAVNGQKSMLRMPH